LQIFNFKEESAVIKHREARRLGRFRLVMRSGAEYIYLAAATAVAKRRERRAPIALAVG